MTDRSIVNFHIPHFCISLMADRDTALRGRPVVVAEQSAQGKVLEISREAHREGVHTGMSTAQARKSCRSLLLVPPDIPLYRTGQSVVLSLLERFTPLVEPSGWGTFFLDLTGTRLLWGAGADAAVKVRNEVMTAAGLLPQIGLAANKLVSSVAGSPSRPRDVCSVLPGEEQRFLFPLHLNAIPRLGDDTCDLLCTELGVCTIGRLAEIPPLLLSRVFGAEGEALARIARGEDREAVVPPEKTISITAAASLPEGENRRHELQAELFILCEKIGRELRKRNRLSTRLTLKLAYLDGMQAGGASVLGEQDDDLDWQLFFKAALLLERIRKRRVRIKELIVSVSGLVMPFPQLTLFPQNIGHAKARALMAAVDQIRERFGTKALAFGRTIS